MLIDILILFIYLYLAVGAIISYMYYAHKVIQARKAKNPDSYGARVVGVLIIMTLYPFLLKTWKK